MRARPLRRIAIALLAAIAASLWGCASSPFSPASQGAAVAANLGSTGRNAAPLPGEPGCFWLSNFDGSWTVLNKSELIIYAPLYSQPYLIRLFAPVPTLKFHERLGFVDTERTGMICNDTMDALVVPHWEPEHVPIVAVRKLTMAEARHLLAENHIKLPRGQKPAKGNQADRR